MIQKNLCVLFGGVSSEHAISILSAASVLQQLNRERYHILPVGITRDGAWIYTPDATPEALTSDTWQTLPRNVPVTLSVNRAFPALLATDGSIAPIPVDCAFPVLHGKNGEDGTIQGLFEIADIAYVGPGVAASANAMDKSITKLLVAPLGIRQAKWLTFSSREVLQNTELVAAQIEAAFSYPVFIKPASTGSSVGINKSKTHADLLKHLVEATRFDAKILVEEFIDGDEIELAVLGNADPLVSGCGQIKPGQEFYSFDAKYNDTASQTIIPAPLPEALCESLRAAASEIYTALGCAGLSRVDFFVTRNTRELVFNEINTIPGFTEISMYSKLMAAAGLPFVALLDRLIDCAFAAQAERRQYV